MSINNRPMPALNMYIGLPRKCLDSLIIRAFLILLAFSAFSELKHVILVDEDVDIFDTDDVLWALNTRYQGDVDTIFIPGVRCHPLDPSQRPDYSPSIPDVGISCKTIFDCTVPFRMKERFRRAEFMEVDPEKWIKKG